MSNDIRPGASETADQSVAAKESPKKIKLHGISGMRPIPKGFEFVPEFGMFAMPECLAHLSAEEIRDAELEIVTGKSISNPKIDENGKALIQRSVLHRVVGQPDLGLQLKGLDPKVLVEAMEELRQGKEITNPGLSQKVKDFLKNTVTLMDFEGNPFSSEAAGNAIPTACISSGNPSSNEGK